MYIEALVEKKRALCFNKNNLEFAGIHSEEEISHIFDMESNLAEAEGDHGPKKLIIKVIRKADLLLQRNRFYRMYFRIWIRKRLFTGKNKETIHMMRLLRMPDEVFFQQLFLQIFNEEPSDEEIKQAKEMYYVQKIKRADLFYHYYNSEDNLWPKRLKWEKTAKIFFDRK